jgi:hypothetical protein
MNAGKAAAAAAAVALGLVGCAGGPLIGWSSFYAVDPLVKSGADFVGQALLVVSVAVVPVCVIAQLLGAVVSIAALALAARDRGPLGLALVGFWLNATAPLGWGFAWGYLGFGYVASHFGAH